MIEVSSVRAAVLHNAGVLVDVCMDSPCEAAVLPGAAGCLLRCCWLALQAQLEMVTIK
jgi:hypothetical protein